VTTAGLADEVLPLDDIAGAVLRRAQAHGGVLARAGERASR
jgi:hypothetical protein